VGPHCVDTDDVARHLRAMLPTYMIPETLRWLPALPLTDNGKTDVRQLSALLVDDCG
jgi:acyl-coenzyme A synthetase/AMP-(fatty) acid ligase